MKKPLEELSKRTLQRKLEQVNKENLTSEESELQLRILRRLYEIDREENPPPTAKFLPEKEWEW